MYVAQMCIILFLLREAFPALIDKKGIFLKAE